MGCAQFILSRHVFTVRSWVCVSHVGRVLGNRPARLYFVKRMALCATSEGELILKSTLLVNNKKCDVQLTTSSFSWDALTSFTQTTGQLVRPTEPIYSSISDINSINIKDFIAVRQGSTLPRESKSDNKYIELTNLKPTSFCLHAVQRLKRHKWRERKIYVECREFSLCQKWVYALGKQLENPALNHPKNLLVLVNPFGGKKRGPKIYRDKVAPLFELAGICTEVIETESRPKHGPSFAEEILLEKDLGSVDGIVCVGGDGSFADVFNGLLKRLMKDHGFDRIHYVDEPVKPSIQLGIIPAGSTDTVAYTTTGLNDPVTSALQIVTGATIEIDTCGMYGPDKILIRFAVSMIAYGFYGDVLRDSEQHRWMGPKRYDWSGFKKFLGNKSYQGTVSFVPTETHEDYNPQDNTRCYTGCDVCASSTDLEAQSRASSIYDLTDWEHRTGSFIGINTFTIPCKTGLTPEGVAPSCHLGDGCTDLVMVKKTGRLQYLQHMLRIAKDSADQFDFDFVEAVRVKAFRYHPCVRGPGTTHSEDQCSSDRQTQSVWNCDGEVIAQPEVSVRVHRQLLKLYASGVGDPSQTRDECVSCTACGTLH